MYVCVYKNGMPLDTFIKILKVDSVSLIKLI